MFFVLKKNGQPVYTSKTQKFISPDLVIFDNSKQKIDFPEGNSDDMISFDFWNREADKIDDPTFLGEFLVNSESLAENCKLDQNVMYPITSDDSGICNGNAIVSTRQILNKPIDFSKEDEIKLNLAQKSGQKSDQKYDRNPEQKIPSQRAETPTNLNDSGVNSSMDSVVNQAQGPEKMDISQFLKDGKLEIPIAQLADKSSKEQGFGPKKVNNRRQAAENISISRGPSHPDPTRGAQRIKIVEKPEAAQRWPILVPLEVSISNLQKLKCNPYVNIAIVGGQPSSYSNKQSAKTNTSHPSWTDIKLPSNSLKKAEHLIITVYHKGVVRDELLGTAKVDAQKLIKDKVMRNVPVSGRACGNNTNISFRLKL